MAYSLGLSVHLQQHSLHRPALDVDYALVVLKRFR